MNKQAKNILNHFLQPILVIVLFLVTWLPQMSIAEEQLVPLHVTSGTNLIHLAREYCHQKSDWKTIAKINRLKSPYLIREQTTLKVPLSLLKYTKLTATLATIRGDVHLVDTHGNKTPATKGATLSSSQTVVTEEDAYAHIIFPDHRYLNIEPDSKVTFNYLISLVDDTVKIDFTLHKGRIFNKIKQRLQSNDSHQIHTPIAITGVRGTEYRIKSGGQESLFETLTGKVDVGAAGTGITLLANQGSRVKPGTTPEKPRPLPSPPTPPLLKPIFRLLPAVIPAPGHPQAETLRMRITADDAGLSTVKEVYCSPEEAFVIDSLPDGSYYSFFTAIDNEGFESLANGPLPLTIRTIPSAPVISSPKEGRISWDKQITITWLKGEQVDRFFYQLATDNAFKNIVVEQETTTPSLTTPELEPGDYSFRVQAISADGFVTLYSPPLLWKMATQPEMQSATTTASEPLALRWSAMAEECTYDLQIAEDRQFTTLLLDKKAITTASYEVQKHLLPGKYFIRIRGVLSPEAIGPWTASQTLEIKRDPLGWKEAMIGVIMLGIILL